MGGTAQIDYNALAQQHGGGASDDGVDYASLAAAHGGAGADSHADILQKYGLPEGVDLTKDATANTDKLFAGSKPGVEGAQERFKRLDAFSKAYQEANPHQADSKGFFASIWDEAKNAFKGMASDGTGTASMPPIPGQGTVDMVRGRTEQFKENPVGATARTLTDVGMAAAPLLMDKLPDIVQGVHPISTVQRALSRQLSVTEAEAMRSGSSAQPALNVTNREVLNHAAQNGVKLTPGQALEDPAATNVQKMGGTAMVGGKDLSVALREQRYAFVDSVNKLGKAVDPNGLGVNEETAGHAIQKAAQDKLNALQGRASATYNQAAAQQQNLSGDIRGLNDFANSKRTETITDPRTGTSATRPIYQPPAVKAALDDIASKPDLLGPNPGIQSLRSLRSEFWEKGNDYSGNIPDSARALYKQAAAKVDDAIMDAAKGTPFESTFRDANSQWKALQGKYNEPGQPLYKILQQNDPTKIVAQLQNAPATDISMLRSELGDGPAVQALRRSVLNDISNHKFGVGANGLGGYSDNYLRALFGDSATKDLYLKADLARRINYDANPSGTGSAVSVLEQGGNLKSQPKLTAFAKMSMPRDPLSFLPSKQGAPSPAVIPKGNPTPFAISGFQQLNGRGNQEAVNQ